MTEAGRGSPRTTPLPGTLLRSSSRVLLRTTGRLEGSSRINALRNSPEVKILHHCLGAALALPQKRGGGRGGGRVVVTLAVCFKDNCASSGPGNSTPKCDCAGAPAICFLSPRPQTHVGTPTCCGTILNVLRPTHSAAPSHTQKHLLLEEPGLKSKCSLSLPPRRPPVAAPPDVRGS